MKTYKKLASFALLAVTSSLAHAAPINGDFPTDLSGWVASGDAAVRDGGAFMTTAFDASDDFSVNFNFSGTPADSSNNLESDGGMAVGALDPDSFNSIFAFEGSQIFQTFNILAGEYLTFDWQFFSNGNTGADYAYVAIDGVVQSFAAQTDATTSSTTYGYAFETAASTFQSSVFLTDATIQVAIGVVDVNDLTETSAIRVDNVSTVPEPTTTMMALVGVLVVMARRRR